MWRVLLEPDFKAEFYELPASVREELTTQLVLLRQLGPMLGRPKVDTLKGSNFANMKELRFYADNGVWRTAFAFDPRRRAILLVAGDKTGVSEDRFYERLLAKADSRYKRHLTRLEAGEEI